MEKGKNMADLLSVRKKKFRYKKDHKATRTSCNIYGKSSQKPGKQYEGGDAESASHDSSVDTESMKASQLADAVEAYVATGKLNVRVLQVQNGFNSIYTADQLETFSSMTGGSFDFKGATISLTNELLTFPKKVALVWHSLSSWNEESRVQTLKVTLHHLLGPWTLLETLKLAETSCPLQRHSQKLLLTRALPAHQRRTATSPATVGWSQELKESFLQPVDCKRNPSWSLIHVVSLNVVFLIFMLFVKLDCK